MTVIPISQKTTVHTNRMCFLNVTVSSLVKHIVIGRLVVLLTISTITVLRVRTYSMRLCVITSSF